MVSKPLHVKRFKKALADYQQSMNSPVSIHHLSTEDTISDRHLFSSLIHPSSTNNSSIISNQISSNWCSNVSFSFRFLFFEKMNI